MLQHVYQRLLHIAPSEATFSRRGFHSLHVATRCHLESIGKSFLYGYNLALRETVLEALASQLDTLPPQGRGFAFEGAAMALTLLDHLSLHPRNRLRRFLSGPGHSHVYMGYVGAGWAWARLPVSIQRARRNLDPLLGWLALDGFGFHAGYFSWQRSIETQVIPRALRGYERCVYDQGLGRSLWFVKGADVGQIATTIATFAPARRADLWSGVGLACTYAGGADQTALTDLCMLADGYGPHLAQGSAFAAKARQHARIDVAHTTSACRALCGICSSEAAAVTDAALVGLPEDTGGGLPAYARWRQRIRQHFDQERILA